MRAWAWLLLCGGGCGWTPDLGACEARLLSAPLRSLPGWQSAELARGGSLQERVDLRVEGAPDCALLLAVEIADVAAGAGRVSVRGAPNGAVIGSVPGSSLPLLPVLLDAAGGAAPEPLLEWSAEGRALPAGAHAVALRWLLYDANRLLAEPLATLDTRWVAEVPAVLEVNLEGPGIRQALAGTTALLDFGELVSGAQRSLVIAIDGNAPARLQLYPQWGELRLEDRPQYRIPYLLRLDGVALASSAAGTTVVIGPGLSRRELQVEIGAVERRAAGVYHDVLTLVVAPE